MPCARWSACAAALCVLLLMAAGVHAQPKPDEKAPAAVDDKEARDLFRLGKQAFDEGRYERALKYFKDAYDLSGRAQLQFNIGTVLDRLRRDREAIDAYKSYLAKTPDAANREVVEERIRLLEAASARPDTTVVPLAPAPSASDQLPGPSPATQPTAAKPAQPVPTPAETARAATPPPAAQDQLATTGPATESSGAITSRWWFWTGLGALAVGAVVVGVAVGSSSGQHTTEGPAVLGPSTRVRPL